MRSSVKAVLAAMLAAACFGLAAGEAKAQNLAMLPPTSVAAVVVAGEARPIAAWVDFCRRNMIECAIDPSEPTTIALTPKVWQTINSVNRQVNASLVGTTDLENLGIPDHWDFPGADGKADCEDYQLLKRRRLAEAGLPRRAMRMTVVIDEEGQGHAVLLIRTDRGDYVLDNKRDQVLPWFQTGYVYVKREGQNSLDWVSLGGASSATMTANR